MSGAKKVGIALPPKIEARLPNARSRSGAVVRACDRYAELIKQTPLPEFARAEWGALSDAARGAWWEPAANIADLWICVEDAPEVVERWDINHAQLVERLKRLSYAEELRIVHELEGGWRDVDS